MAECPERDASVTVVDLALSSINITGRLFLPFCLKVGFLCFSSIDILGLIDVLLQGM